MDDEFKKDEPLMGDSSELDAEIADFGKDSGDSFDAKKPETEPIVDEAATADAVDMSAPEVDSVNIEKTDIAEEPKEVESEEEPVSEIGAAMDAMLEAEEDAASEAKPEGETPEGAKPEEAEPADEVKVEADAATVEATAEVAAEATAGTAATDASVADNAEPKKKGKKGVLIALIILVLAVAGVICAIMLMPKDNKGAKKDTPAGQDEVVSLKMKDNSLSDFDLKFLKLENKTENKIYSPLSIKYALAMLQDGAVGDSKTQIEDIIGDYKPKKYINSKNLSLANSFFVRDSFKESVKSEYAEDINKKYAAELVYDSFSTAANINKWISTKTLGQINNFLTDDWLEDKSFVLINALAIDMNWKNKIQCAYNENTEVQVPCLVGYYSIDYAHEDYGDFINNIQSENEYEALKFNDKENTKAVKFGANVNRYDIIKEVGEETIRSTVKTELEKWLKEEDPDDPEKVKNFYEDFKDTDDYLEKYMSALKENYGQKEASTDFMFYVDDATKVFAKDLKEYDGITLQYVAIMPTNVELKEYVEGMNAEKISGLIGNLKDASNMESYKDGVVTDLDGIVPLFKYKYTLQAQDDLESIGVKDVFSEKANLSNMTTDSSMFIESMLHGAQIEFSNEGIKAAAVSALGGAGAAFGGFEYLWDVPVEKIDLTFDKPFLFLIRDKATGEVWFTGTVYEGLQNK